MAFCNKCGFKNQDDFVSCKSCGAMLTLEDSQITSSTGLETNIASFLCYLVIWISGLVFVLIEKEDKVVRFHAYQSLTFLWA